MNIVKVKLKNDLLKIIKDYDNSINNYQVYSYMHPNFKKDKRILKYFRRKQGKIVTINFFRGDAFDKIHDIFLPKDAFLYLNNE